MSIKLSHEKNEYNEKVLEAMRGGDDAACLAAFEAMCARAAEKVKADYEELAASNDEAVLAQRGYRQLTASEKKWYQRVITSLKTSNPKQAFTAIVNGDTEDDIMPTTIIEDVYKHLADDHPLLKAINFQHVGYNTKWIVNDHSAQNAVWGKITDEIVKEITSSFKVIDVDQNKLSAYAIIENGMLDLGPVFLDGYIRTVLSEAIMSGLEKAIIAGTGVNEPVGLIKNISEGVSYSSTTGYPDKSAVSVADFTPATYGALVAQLALTESGRKRKFGEVGLIVNQSDYLTKVMPATTVLNANGTYVNNLFPFPTTVYVSNEVEDGKAVMFLRDEYFLGMGGTKNGVIEVSDEYKFVEDQTVFKIKQYGAGRAYDNTAALYLDISKLEPAYITVKNTEVVA